MSFDIKDIISRISKLNQKEKVHILNILHTKNIEYTKNANGYFFNFLNIDDDIIEKIYNCLILIEENTDMIKEMERRRNELLQYYKLLIEERLQNNLQKKRDNYIKKLIIKKYTEITLVKKRKNIINKKYINPNIDPDILLKEHLKSKFKYQKNSIYHRLVTCIKLSKSNKNKNTCKNEDDNDMSSDIKSNYDIDTVDDISENDVNLDDYNISDVDDNFDDFDTSSIIDKESGIVDEIDEGDDNDEIIEVEDIDYVDEDIFPSNKSIDYKKMEFLYYKRLLNDQGFVFDENKECLLITQEYIQ
jgi:hypothetical protein